MTMRCRGPCEQSERRGFKVFLAPPFFPLQAKSGEGSILSSSSTTTTTARLPVPNQLRKTSSRIMTKTLLSTERCPSMHAVICGGHASVYLPRWHVYVQMPADLYTCVPCSRREREERVAFFPLRRSMPPSASSLPLASPGVATPSAVSRIPCVLVFSNVSRMPSKLRQGREGVLSFHEDSRIDSKKGEKTRRR